MIKVIHCSDLHLDSSMETRLSKENVKERKAELLATFGRMVDYAEEHQVKAIIIAGDLYDKKNISKSAKIIIKSMIINHPYIDFYYLKGNHDAGNILAEFDELPENLKMFTEQWTSYNIDEAGKIVLTGVELTKDNATNISYSLVLDNEKYNIVTLHGQIGEYKAKDKTEHIALSEYRDKGIDYMALGHIHSYQQGGLDRRGTYCYPGCLEGRGFDECGEHGFVLLTINEDERTMKSEFVPIASRNLYEVDVDITGTESTVDISERIRNTLEGLNYSERSLMRVNLVGKMDFQSEKNIEFLTTQYKEQFFYFEVKDKSVYEINYSEYRYDASLKGEFIRNVEARNDISDEEKATIIRYGIQALTGEELQ